MDKARFDDLTKQVSTSISRRTGLGLLLAVAVAALPPPTTDAKPNRKCKPPTKKCGGKCVRVQSDNKHCGKCDKKCPNGQQCLKGACSCPVGQIACADNTCAVCCVNTDCAAFSGSTCQNGRCACPSDQLACDGACVSGVCCVDTDCPTGFTCNQFHSCVG